MRAVTLVLLGLAAGVVSAMLQTYVLREGPVALPLGAAAAIFVVVLLARASAWWVRARWGAVVFSVAWLVATLVMGTTTPGGDLVLASGTQQVAYLMLGGMLLAAACGFPLLPEDEDRWLAAGPVRSIDA